MPGTEREEEGDGSRKLSFMPDDMCTTRNFNSFYPIIAIVCLDGEEVKSQGSRQTPERIRQMIVCGKDDLKLRHRLVEMMCSRVPS